MMSYTWAVTQEKAVGDVMTTIKYLPLEIMTDFGLRNSVRSNYFDYHRVKEF